MNIFIILWGLQYYSPDKPKEVLDCLVLLPMMKCWCQRMQLLVADVVVAFLSC